jgi:hypothetical protein
MTKAERSRSTMRGEPEPNRGFERTLDEGFDLDLAVFLGCDRFRFVDGEVDERSLSEAVGGEGSGATEESEGGGVSSSGVDVMDSTRGREGGGTIFSVDARGEMAAAVGSRGGGKKLGEASASSASEGDMSGGAGLNDGLQDGSRK